MSDQFNSWWNNGESLTDNPYEPDSAAFWAWEGWCAAVKAEREACAKVCETFYNHEAKDCADAIRERGKA